MSLALVLALAGPAPPQALPDPDRTTQSRASVVPITLAPPIAALGTIGSGVLMEASGIDTAQVVEFFRLTNFDSRPVQSVAIDISIVSGAFFDLDGGSNLGGSMAPVLGNTIGLQPADISFLYDNSYPHPQRVEVAFSPPLGSGAWLTFGMDTDYFIGDPCPGGYFGAAPAQVLVTFANGESCSIAFSLATGTSSIADCGVAAYHSYCEPGVDLSIPCPCANDSGLGLHAGCLNSTGASGVLAALGTTRTSADDLALQLYGLPAGEFGLVYLGDTAVSFAFGDGVRCVASNMLRLAIQPTGSQGSFAYTNIASHVGAVPGQVRRFQGWYRDPQGPCGSSFNFTNALEIAFVQ